MSLLQLDYDIMPFTFADVLILRYLMGIVDAEQTVEDFELVNNQSQLNWSFRSQISKFIKRFFKEPYREEERQWIKDLATKYNIRIKQQTYIKIFRGPFRRSFYYTENLERRLWQEESQSQQR